MERFLFVFIHVGLPILVFLGLIYNRPKSKCGIISTHLFYVLLLAFLYLWGQWPIAFTLYFKYVVLVLLVYSFLIGIRRWKQNARWFPKGILKVGRVVFMVLLIFLLAPLVAYLVVGRTYPREPVSLYFPLRNGTYYVALGGSNRVINNHYGTPGLSQWYALDFNKLGKMGMVANPLWSSENESHAIFGEPVYCPCDGRVMEAKDYVPDNEGASMQVSAEAGMGNYITVACDDVFVTMVHLQQNSVKVKLGELVSKGELLARVGNSGFSQEPHLHFQAAQYDKDSVLVGVPIKFYGRTLVRNDIIDLN